MQKALQYVLARLHIFFLTVMMLMLVEYLDRGVSVYQTLGWVYVHPGEFLLNGLIVFTLFLLVIALTRGTRIAFWVTSLLLFIVALISGIKFKILGVPLLPWDVFLGGEAADMTQYLNGLVNAKLIGSVLAYIAAGFVLLYKVPYFRVKIKWKEQLVFFALALFLSYTLYYDKPVHIKQALHISTISWDQAANYKQNGFMLSTMMNVDLVIIKKPEGYDAKRIDTILNGIKKDQNGDPNFKPNVIVVLSEAFWDPTVMKNITFNQDPLPHLHALQKTQTSGWMLSPQFGGGTANVEFEVLSGNTMRFMPQGCLAYIQYVNHGIDSLASILSRQGYTTTAINPFYNWFFNSRNVYHNFGFSRFISSEFFDPEEKKGINLADSEVANKIIEESDKSPGPDMIFANTMENHWPFYKGKFKENDFTVQGDIPQDSKEMLESYAQGISDADKMLQQLVDHFSQKNEPTIILFFGDHLPVLGDNYKVYRDAKYLEPNDPDFLQKMFNTPFVIWNNFAPEHKEMRVSPNYLGSYVLKTAKKEGTFYTDYLYALSQKYPIIPPKGYYSKMGINETDLKDYEYLQYDIMFGGHYAYRDIMDKIISKNYTLGYGNMVIDSITATAATGQFDNAADGEASLVLKGKNFVPLSVVYANGKELATKLSKTDGTLSALLPKSLNKKPGMLDVQVKLTDSQHVDIAKSNIFQFNMVK
jgi:phosphoglycerol transferase MdoB-like AlkP superfamily enzyme